MKLGAKPSVHSSLYHQHADTATDAHSCNLISKLINCTVPYCTKLYIKINTEFPLRQSATYRYRTDGRTAVTYAKSSSYFYFCWFNSLWHKTLLSFWPTFAAQCIGGTSSFANILQAGAAHREDTSPIFSKILSLWNPPRPCEQPTSPQTLYTVWWKDIYGANMMAMVADCTVGEGASEVLLYSSNIGDNGNHWWHQVTEIICNGIINTFVTFLPEWSRIQHNFFLILILQMCGINERRNWTKFTWHVGPSIWNPWKLPGTPGLPNNPQNIIIATQSNLYIQEDLSLSLYLSLCLTNTDNKQKCIWSKGMLAKIQIDGGLVAKIQIQTSRGRGVVYRVSDTDGLH